MGDLVYIRLYFSGHFLEINSTLAQASLEAQGNICKSLPEVGLKNPTGPAGRQVY